MSRGYAYEIATDIDGIGNMDKSSLFDLLDTLSIDFVDDVNPTTTEELRASLVRTFQSMGCTVKIETMDSNGDYNYLNEIYPDGIISVTGITPMAKQHFFAERFRRAKSILSAMTLDQFAVNSQDTSLYNLKMAIEDDYGDIVMLDGTYYTFDYFIRNAETNKTYYIGNVVYMH